MRPDTDTDSDGRRDHIACLACFSDGSFLIPAALQLHGVTSVQNVLLRARTNVMADASAAFVLSSTIYDGGNGTSIYNLLVRLLRQRCFV